MIDEHSREDELIVQIIGLKGKIEKLQEEKKKHIEEFIEDFHEIHRYCDKWDYNIPQISWDKLKKYEERKNV